jgi:hypothetical protein
MDLIDTTTSPCDGAGAGVKPLSQWSTEDVVLWLEELGMSQYVESFRRHAIDGEELQTLTQDTMNDALQIGKIPNLLIIIVLVRR